jgi:hypothetical protein
MNADASGRLHTSPHLHMCLVASMRREFGLEQVQQDPYTLVHLRVGNTLKDLFLYFSSFQQLLYNSSLIHIHMLIM